MADFDNTNRGVLFTNKKRKSENSPAFTGRININGVDHWISAWGKTVGKGERQGEKFLSLSVEKIQPKNDPAGPASFDDFDDEIPF